MLEELKTLIAVVECKNFTKAGENLKLSQPSVSTHIKNLENRFGVTLIDRSIKQKTIYITESGYILYNRSKEILNLLDKVDHEMKDVSDSVIGHVKVGASFTIGEHILPKFLTNFTKSYPDIDIEIFIQNTSQVSSHIKNLNYDVGLVEGTTSSSHFIQKYFLMDKMILAMPYDRNLSSENFSFDSLQNKIWVARENGSGTREYLNMFLNSNEIVPKNIIILGSNYAVKEAVKNGLGITIISNLVTKSDVKNKTLSTIELDENFNRHLSYIIPKNTTLSKSVDVFLSELCNYCSKFNN
ncbi:LysR family transcriptional regulator [Metaclostridioides mangenotii]|uniref:DNA-binding transcriptional LysR family regulator n=2 Tax=Metaclostridioides mangenotii TaxID=1540 RepID=A0ABS4ECS0_9FIRM|nr:LysR family transcriptional regulator [Clostridioides mangenotii]MBP1855732.1 DNA-binding transcriptional LysR family regulator [Clostridioides mangenotii]